MHSNKFDVGFVYVCKVEIIRINFKFLLVMGNIFFFKFPISFFGKFFVVYIFFPTKLAKLRKFETKKTCWLRWGRVNPIIWTFK